MNTVFKQFAINRHKPFDELEKELMVNYNKKENHLQIHLVKEDVILYWKNPGLMVINDIIEVFQNWKEIVVLAIPIKTDSKNIPYHYPPEFRYNSTTEFWCVMELIYIDTPPIEMFVDLNKISRFNITKITRVKSSLMVKDLNDNVFIFPEAKNLGILDSEDNINKISFKFNVDYRNIKNVLNKQIIIVDELIENGVESDLYGFPGDDKPEKLCTFTENSGTSIADTSCGMTFQLNSILYASIRICKNCPNCGGKIIKNIIENK